MKKLFALILLLLALVVLALVFLLSYLGFVPVLSTLLGTDKPRDLGIKYTEADIKSLRSKSQMEYTQLPNTPIPLKTRQFSGARPVTADFTSAEITATLNNQPWRYWPYKNVQVKFNADGSGEISGVLVKEKLQGYTEVIGLPKEAADFVMKFLPNDPVFYVKMRASLTDNKVSLFEPQSLEIGRITVPLGIFLSFKKPDLTKEAFAEGPSEMFKELNKIKDKRTLVISYIDHRLTNAFGSFYAKKAYFGENKLYFDGTLSEKISYTP